MKRLITFIDKYDTLIMILIIGIIVILEIFQGALIAEDSLFDFGNMYKLYQGKLIYKDVNILITPLFFIIGKLLLSIFHGNYLTFLLYGIIIMTLLYMIIYNIFKILKVKKQFAMIFTLSIVMMSIEIIKGGTNYNALGLIFVLLGIMYTLKNAENIQEKNKNFENTLNHNNKKTTRYKETTKFDNIMQKYNNLIQAVIIVTTFLTMQKLGARICNKLYFI